MKALTVQQPWAWAIIHGGKDVENRTQAWGYRGPLAIHAGARWSDRGARSPLVAAAYLNALEQGGWRAVDRDGAIENITRLGIPRDRIQPDWFGAIIGVVDLVDVHLDQHHEVAGFQIPACCESPWAESKYDEHGGRTRRDIVHLVLANPRPLTVPIPCRGALGLWTPPAEVLEQLQAVA